MNRASQSPVSRGICSPAVFVVLMFVAFSGVFGASEDPFGPVGITTSPSPLYPGLETARLDIVLILPPGSEADLYDVSILMDVGFPFSTVNPIGNIGRMSASLTEGFAASAAFYVDVSEDAVPGEHEIPLVITYRTEATGSLQTVERSAKVKISAIPDDPFGQIEFEVQPDPVYPGVRGGRVDVSLPLPTGTISEVYNVTLSLITQQPISVRTGSVSLGRLARGSSIHGSFLIDVDDLAPAGVVENGIQVSYQLVPGGRIRTVTRLLEILVEEPLLDPFGWVEISASGPVYSGLGGVQLEVAVSYPVGMPRLHDVKVLLNDLGPFLRTGSPERSVGVLEAGKTVTLSYSLDVTPSAPEGEHGLSVVIGYRLSPVGVQSEVTRRFSLYVREIPTDPFGELEATTVPLDLHPGQDAKLGFTLSLVAAPALYQVLLLPATSGPLEVRGSWVDLGSMTQGSSSSAFFPLHIDDEAQAGSYPAVVNIAYRSSPAASYRNITRTLTFSVEPLPSDPFGSVGLQPTVLRSGFRGQALDLVVEGGPIDLYDVSLSVSPPGGISFDPPISQLGMVEEGSISPIRIHADVERTVEAGYYEIAVELSYRTSPVSGFRKVGRFLGVSLQGVPEDPFGAAVVTTLPEELVAGSKNIELLVVLSFPEDSVDEVQNLSLTLAAESPLQIREKGFFVGRARGGTQIPANFHMDVDDSAATGQYAIDLTATYDLPNGFSGRADRSLKLRICEARSQLVVGVSDPIRLPGGSRSTITFSVRNEGLGAASQIVARLLPNPESPVKPVGEEVFLETLGPGARADVGLGVTVDSGASGTSLVTMQLSYLNQGNEHTDQHFVSVLVGLEQKPVVFVASVATDPEKAHIGGYVNTTLVLQNGGDATARFVVLSLYPITALAVIGSGSQVNVGSLGPSETLEVPFRFLVDSESRPGRVNIPYVITYRDPGNMDIRVNGSFGMELTGRPKLVVKNIEIDPQVLVQHTDGLMMITLANTGTDDANEIEIAISGGEGILASTMGHIGVVEPGAVEAALFGIFVDRSLDPGSYSIVVKIFYRDQYGAEYEDSAAFDIKVYEEEPLVPDILIITSVIIVLVVLVVYIYFRGVPGLSEE